MLPVLEVQDDVPSNSSLHSDFHWLSKICFLWSDLPRLRADMARLAAHSLRSRLLTAAAQMQVGKYLLFYEKNLINNICAVCTGD